MTKLIRTYEEYLDQQAKTTYETDLNKEVKEILDLIHVTNETTASVLIKVLVGKGIVNIKDFKRVLEE